MGARCVGVKIRTRRCAWGSSGLNTNTVSDRFISRAARCMVSALRPEASVNTATWLPWSGSSVNTSAIV